MATPHIAKELTRLALPLVPTHGFTTETLVLASSSLSAASKPLSARTIDALYPSPPANLPSTGSFSLKGLAIGNGGKRSLSRTELIALARGQGIVQGSSESDREKTGPARALFQEWLEQGRREMVEAIRQSRLGGADAINRGIRARLTYNEPVLDRLPQVRRLCCCRNVHTTLSRRSSLLSFVAGSRSLVRPDNDTTLVSFIDFAVTGSPLGTLR